MMRFLVLVGLLTSSAISLQYGAYQPQQKLSAASEAQIRFAIENKYDDTGPGSKGPEYAYDTYKTLEDAIVSYIDDPDTKLPEIEKAKGIQKLYDNQNSDKLAYHFKPNFNLIKPVPLTLPTFTDNNILYNSNVNFQPFQPNAFSNDLLLQDVEKQRVDPFRVHKFQGVKGSPLNLAHFTRGPELDLRETKHKPNYAFSYGVHDKKTGDLKSAHETKDGNVVRGYYSFLDADGQQRTVHYTADDKQGFRAVVSRTNSNKQ